MNVPPDCYMPFRTKLNPAVTEATRHSLDWAERFGLLASETDRERLKEGNYALLCSYFFPEASREDLELVTDWAVWEFTLDDSFNDTYQSAGDQRRVELIVSRLRTFLPVNPGPLPVPASPVEQALADLWQRTVHRMTPTWRRRFFGGIVKFMEAYVWETGNLLRNAPPDLIEHIQTRRYGSGTQPMLDLLELTMGSEIPPDLAATRTISTVMESIVDGIMHINDIFSHRKERAHEDIHNNIHILQELLGCDFPTAAQQVNALASSRVRLYERLISEEIPWLLAHHNVSPSTREAILTWSQRTTYWLPGNLEWHQRTHRYTNIELWRPNQNDSKWLPTTTT